MPSELTDDDRLSFQIDEGDFGSPDDRVLSNRMVFTRTRHECHGDGIRREPHDIEPGTRARRETGVFDGEMLTVYVCEPCCDSWLRYMNGDDEGGDDA